MSHDAVDLENLPVSAEEAHAELEIVLRSPTFDRSERLHKFLRYICELTLKGDAARINEYLIGSEVFQKGPDYNPNEDSIVRRQAHALRKKLHEYYEGEGKVRPIKIELPVGRYVPAFRRAEIPAAPRVVAQDIEAIAPAPDVTVEKVSPKTPRSFVKWWRFALAGAVLFAIGLGIGSMRTSEVRSQKRIGPAAEEIWSAWMNTSREAVICLSNPDSAVIKRLDQAPGPEYRPLRHPLNPTEDAIVRETLRMPPWRPHLFHPRYQHGQDGRGLSGHFPQPVSDASRRASRRNAKPNLRLGGFESAERHLPRQ